MRSSQSLSVADRVRAALQFKQHESPGVHTSISEICRLAGVNRANLYARYPELIAQLQLGRKSKHDSAAGLPSIDNRIPKPASETVVEHRNKALLYLSLEMKAQIVELEARAESARTNRKSKRTR